VNKTTTLSSVDSARQQLILEKIERFGPEVAELAEEALKLSEILPEQSVAEQLESIVRNIIRRRGD
jgi:uncharacterized protein (UPF0335 family)